MYVTMKKFSGTLEMIPKNKLSSKGLASVMVNMDGNLLNINHFERSGLNT